MQVDVPGDAQHLYIQFEKFEITSQDGSQVVLVRQLSPETVKVLILPLLTFYPLPQYDIVC